MVGTYSEAEGGIKIRTTWHFLNKASSHEYPRNDTSPVVTFSSISEPNRSISAPSQTRQALPDTINGHD